MKQFFFTIDCDWIPGSEKGLEGLLDISQKLKPTLFVTGKFAVSYPEILKQASDHGCEIGTHGWEHGLKTDENYRSTSYQQQKRWIDLSTKVIEEVIGKQPVSFRAPNLWISETLLKILEETSYRFDSSVPARRFDFWMGQVNQWRYFRSALNPYHPSASHFGRSGNSSLLEVPPSAYFIPLNMSALRKLGIGILKQVIKQIEKRSSILVFYSHPAEFVKASELSLPTEETANFSQKMGPENFPLLEELLHYIINKGYTPSLISEARI